MAARQGRQGVVFELLRCNAAVDDRSRRFNFTPLHWAASNGHRAIVDALLAAGADVLACNSSGETAAEMAGRNGFTELCAALVAAEAGGGGEGLRRETTAGATGGGGAAGGDDGTGSKGGSSGSGGSGGSTAPEGLRKRGRDTGASGGDNPEAGASLDSLVRRKKKEDCLTTWWTVIVSVGVALFVGVPAYGLVLVLQQQQP